jgi:hypothetical protein
MERGQNIRPSQLITTYGVGSIIETPQGPGVISDMAISSLLPNPAGGEPGKVTNLWDFEISEPRLSAGPLNGAKILRIPSNADLQLGSSEIAYRLQSFPNWALCVKHNRLYYIPPQKDPVTGCSDCGSMQRKWAVVKQREEAVSFVRACRAGHLDDVDWRYAVHADAKVPMCNSNEYEWTGPGGSLRNVEIVCVGCQARGNLGRIYSTPWPCSGRYPELGWDRPGCALNSSVLQRGASNLRIPEIVGALSIPDKEGPLHNIFSLKVFKTLLFRRTIGSKQELLDLIESFKAEQGVSIPSETEQAILVADEADILEAIEDTKTPPPVKTPDQIREDELLKLRKAAKVGAPAKKSKSPVVPPDFEVLPGSTVTVKTPHGVFRVTPVSRLRVVLVQKGYRRIDSDTGQGSVVTERSYHDGAGAWFPGVAVSGEGLFIDFAREKSGVESPLKVQGPEAAVWLGEWNAKTGEDDQLRHHPVFVWWHTLSHRLLNALSVDSGYAAAALRERVLVRVDPTTGEADGGVLIYTAQQGGDGTLGGLIALAPRFGDVIASALRYVDACSNDPICEEEEFTPGKANGAACYACQLAAETSCEFLNTSLDRNVLRGNMP